MSNAGRKAVGRGLGLVAMAVMLAAVPGGGQERGGVDGSSVFKTYCSSCHGPQARGDGPLAEHLRVRPADLTLIAKRNGGEFPSAKVHKMIDGRAAVKGHGGSDMPVWGDAFKSSHDGYSEEKVKEKIAALVEHLEALQVRDAK